MYEDCIFCNTPAGALVFENQDGKVILDDPVCPGHVLVGARSHGAGLTDISAEDAAAMMRLANRAAKLIVSALGAEKVYVAAIGDKDKHFHVHLLPKMSADPNLGPSIFGADGWISFMPPSVDQNGVAEITKILQDGLSIEK